MDYRAIDDTVLRKVTTEALQRVGATITRGNSYLEVGCADAGELRMALQGAEILRRENGQGVAARSYYNIECAILRKLSTLLTRDEKRADLEDADINPDRFVSHMMQQVTKLKAQPPNPAERG